MNIKAMIIETKASQPKIEDFCRTMINLPECDSDEYSSSLEDFPPC